LFYYWTCLEDRASHRDRHTDVDPGGVAFGHAKILSENPIPLSKRFKFLRVRLRRSKQSRVAPVKRIDKE
jgi:hypothetical protein